MRRSPMVGSALVVTLLVAACSSPSESPRDTAQGGDQAPVPSDIASSSPGTKQSSTRRVCPPLLADIPEDLVTRRTHKSTGTEPPASLGIIWSNEDSSRVVNISSAASDEPFGDGAASEPTKRQVQGTVGWEVANGDVRAITWQQAGAKTPCTFWTVVAQGLSPREVTHVLESVRERSE